MRMCIWGILCSMAASYMVAAVAHNVVANSVRGIVIGSLANNDQAIMLEKTHDVGVAEFTNLSVGSGNVVRCVTEDGYARANRVPLMILRDNSQITIGGELRVDSPELRVLLHAPNLTMAEGGMLTTGIGDQSAVCFLPSLLPSSMQEVVMINIVSGTSDVATIVEATDPVVHDLRADGYLNWHNAANNSPLSSHVSGLVYFGSAAIPSNLEEAGHKNLVLTKLAPVSGGAFYVITKAGLEVGNELARGIYGDDAEFAVTQYTLEEDGSGGYALRTTDDQGSTDVAVELVPSDDFVTFVEAIDASEGVEADDAPRRGLGAVVQGEVFDPAAPEVVDADPVEETPVNAVSANEEPIGGFAYQGEQDAERQGFVVDASNDDVFAPLDTISDELGASFNDIPGFGVDVPADVSFDDPGVFDASASDNPFDTPSDVDSIDSFDGSRQESYSLDDQGNIVPPVNEQGETYDPYGVFDEQGNLQGDSEEIGDIADEGLSGGVLPDPTFAEDLTDTANVTTSEAQESKVDETRDERARRLARGRRSAEPRATRSR